MFGQSLRSTLVPALFLFMLLLWTGVSSWAAASFEALPASGVDQAQKNSADLIGTDLLTKWNKGEFEPLSDDFTSVMKETLDPASQKKAWLALKSLFGGFEKLHFVEATVSKDLPNQILYRFKGTFAAAPKKPEVRVVIRKSDGKCSGFWIKPWKDKVQ